MTPIDWIIVAVYIVGVIAVGIHFARKSASSIQSYFLSNNETKWWMLAASGATSYYDLAGTMFLVSVFFVMGLKSFFMMSAWGMFSLAFVTSFMAVWIRRSRVMTAVELLYLRFGANHGGRLARTAGAILMVSFLVFSVSYSFIGLSKFLPILIPELAANGHDLGQKWAIILIALTTIYVTVGGFSGVIITDVIQAVLTSIGGLAVGIYVFLQLDTEAVATIHEKFDLSFIASNGVLVNLPPGYEGWENFGILTVFWLAAGLLFSFTGAGGHHQEQRFLATSSHADAAKVAFAWGIFSIPRWFMVAGFCFLALSGILGSSEPEKILPVVIADLMPPVLRGILVASLMAAFMSTFSSILNAGASMVVRDLVQPAMPDLTERNLVRFSYVATVMIVVLGLLIGSNAESLKIIWTFMLIGMIGGSIVPNIMRWYWWRLNGWGYSLGIFCGLGTALLVFAAQQIWSIEMEEFQYAPVIWVITAVACIAGSLMTEPTAPEITDEFYRRIRPFGFWKPVRERLQIDPATEKSFLSPGRIALNIVLNLALLICIYSVAFFFVGHYLRLFLLTTGAVIVLCVALYYSWYRPLKDLDDDPIDLTPSPSE